MVIKAPKVAVTELAEVMSIPAIKREDFHATSMMMLEQYMDALRAFVAANDSGNIKESNRQYQNVLRKFKEMKEYSAETGRKVFGPIPQK